MCKQAINDGTERRPRHTKVQRERQQLPCETQQPHT